MTRILKSLTILALMLSANTGFSQTNAAINCYLGGIVPTESLHDTVLTFQNNSITDVDILWVSYEGEEVYYNTLAPGETYDQPSYYGHPWVVYRAESNVCKVILVPYSPFVVVVID